MDDRGVSCVFLFPSKIFPGVDLVRKMVDMALSSSRMDKKFATSHCASDVSRLNRASIASCRWLFISSRSIAGGRALKSFLGLTFSSCWM